MIKKVKSRSKCGKHLNKLPNAIFMEHSIYLFFQGHIFCLRAEKTFGRDFILVIFLFSSVLSQTFALVLFLTIHFFQPVLLRFCHIFLRSTCSGIVWFVECLGIHRRRIWWNFLEHTSISNILLNTCHCHFCFEMVTLYVYRRSWIFKCDVTMT